MECISVRGLLPSCWHASSGIESLADLKGVPWPFPVTPFRGQRSWSWVAWCCLWYLQFRFLAFLVIYFCASAVTPVVLATCWLALP